MQPPFFILLDQASGKTETRLNVPTDRQRIIDLLSLNELDIFELSNGIGLPVKEVISHLEHVQKSTRPPKRFLVTPARCRSCGFVFKDRRKLKPPGRCPKCKASRIQEPRYRIV